MRWRDGCGGGGGGGMKMEMCFAILFGAVALDTIFYYALLPFH